MKRFSELLDALIFSPRRNVKLAHLSGWLRQTPHPDRGWGLAALTGDLDFSHVKAWVVRELAAEVSDPELFALSYDFVGDLAETVALLWPSDRQGSPDSQADSQKGDSALRLGQIVASLQNTPRKQVKMVLAGWMDQLTVADIMVGTTLGFARKLSVDCADPAVDAYLEQLFSRPAFKAAETKGI